MDIKGTNLCFNEQLFFKKDFSVDEFLSEHRRIANLETLRDDLGIFLKNLRSSTIELINKDYADFVDLSSNLIILPQSISRIEAPIVKIQEEILRAKTTLDERIDRITNLLNQRKNIRKKMQSIQSTIKIQNNLEKMNTLLMDVSNNDSDYSANILKMEHILNEINLHYFHSKQCNSDSNQTLRKEFDNLFEIFLSHLKDLFLKSIKMEKKGLINCLRLYYAVNKVSLAHEIVRQEIVLHKFSRIINEESLRNEPTGLEGLYAKILSFIDKEMKFILNLTQTSSRDRHVSGFDFMVNSVWPELGERLEFNLKSIYSPGNPNTFFKCYTETFIFLDKFEERCVTLTSVNNLRNLNSYHNFLHCWNLPVYYTLRFQEYGGKLEKIIHSHKFTATKEPSEWKLLVTKEVWNSLLRCWDKDVFIRQLAHRFWKFNLQMIARYTVWMQNMIDMKSLNQLPTSKIDFLMHLYSDGYGLIQKFSKIFEIAKERIGLELSQHILNNMQKCLQQSEENLQTTLKNVEQKVIELISEKNVSILRQVSDIPRLYRRTNREIPNQPCSYVLSLFGPVYEMQKNHPLLASNWIPPILSAITSAYHEQVSEVLTSVQKTEESLRKFKKIRDPSNLEHKNNTDDDKIRLQLRIDIQHYIDALKSLTNSIDDIVKFQDLNEILKSLKKN